jgi:hypothetical protein
LPKPWGLSRRRKSLAETAGPGRGMSRFRETEILGLMQLNLNGGAGCGVTEDAATGAMAAAFGVTGSRCPSDENRVIAAAYIEFGRQRTVLPVTTSLVLDHRPQYFQRCIDSCLPELRTGSWAGLRVLGAGCDSGFGE